MIHSFRQIVVAMLPVIAIAGLGARGAADEGRCAHCGCQAHCRKVCRLVCEEKKVAVTCWGVECEDFCVAGPSKPGCRHCEWVCDEDADCESPCARPKKFVWFEWAAGFWAKPHTRNKLMKKTVTKKVPSHKWVIEELCPACAVQCEHSPGSASAPSPER